jgi:hypothetical protein
LLAYRLSSDMDWGPTKIGRFLFSDKSANAAKTKARDLVNRGREFVEGGYLALAMRALTDSAKAKPKADSSHSAQLTCETIESRDPHKYLIISPLPPIR